LLSGSLRLINLTDLSQVAQKPLGVARSAYALDGASHPLAIRKNGRLYMADNAKAHFELPDV
jgi:hypothetical protein